MKTGRQIQISEDSVCVHLDLFHIEVREFCYNCLGSDGTYGKVVSAGSHSCSSLLTSVTRYFFVKIPGDGKE